MSFVFPVPSLTCDSERDYRGYAATRSAGCSIERGGRPDLTTARHLRIPIASAGSRMAASLLRMAIVAFVPGALLDQAFEFLTGGAERWAGLGSRGASYKTRLHGQSFLSILRSARLQGRSIVSKSSRISPSVVLAAPLVLVGFSCGEWGTISPACSRCHSMLPRAHSFSIGFGLSSADGRCHVPAAFIFAVSSRAIARYAAPGVDQSGPADANTIASAAAFAVSSDPPTP
jgi:hypothetical protein